MKGAEEPLRRAEDSEPGPRGRRRASVLLRARTRGNKCRPQRERNTEGGRGEAMTRSLRGATNVCSSSQSSWSRLAELPRPFSANSMAAWQRRGEMC